MIDRSVLLLLIEDHMIVRTAMASLLRGIGFVNIEEAGTFAEARSLMVSGKCIDLALLDLNLPDCCGMATIESLQEIDPIMPIMLITAENEPSTIISAFERGVLGFVPKTASPKLMLAAIDLVLSGGKYIPPEILATLSGAAVKRSSDAVQKLDDSGTDDVRTMFTGLTLRQKEVSEHLLQGLSNKEIARVMAISPGTVRIHISAIFRALNVKSRTQVLCLLSKKL